MYPLDTFDAVEVWNGLWSSDWPRNADNGAAVAEWGRALGTGIHEGRWLPAIGSSDAHLDGQIAIPHTVVLADELSTSAVLAGIRAGNSWIAGSAAVSLSLEVRAGGRVTGIGGQMETGGEPAVVRVVVEGVPSGTVSFHTDQGTVQREPLPAEGPGTIEWRTSAEESAFVRVRCGQNRRTSIRQIARCGCQS
jgi:PHP domain-containing protein